MTDSAKKRRRRRDAKLSELRFTVENAIERESRGRSARDAVGIQAAINLELYSMLHQLIDITQETDTC